MDNKSSVVRLYDACKNVKKKLDDFLREVDSIYALAGVCGGEVSRAVNQEFQSEFIPAVNNLRQITPKHIDNIKNYLEHLPLAAVLSTDDPSDNVTGSYSNIPGVSSEDSGLNTASGALGLNPGSLNPDVQEGYSYSGEQAPASVSGATADKAIEDLPKGTSFTNGGYNGTTALNPMKNSVKTKKPRVTEATVYQVIRETNIGSSLDANTSRIEPKVICEYKSKKDAEEMVEKLMSTVTEGDNDVIKPVYKVIETEYYA